MTTLPLLIALLLSGEPFRFEPIPMDAAELPAPVELPEDMPADESTGNAAAGGVTPGAHDERRAPVDPRPVVFLYTSPGCFAGDMMRIANTRGEFVGLKVIERPPPDWYTLCPTFHWQGADGTWKKYPRDSADYRGVAGMLAAFDVANPGARIKATASRATGASPFDQLQKFTGAGGKFAFIPDTPITAELDDRTSVRYPSLQGRYTVRNGVVELKLEPPLPAGTYRKWISFGFQITGAAGPENVTPKTMDMRIDTNRGPQRVTIQMEPQKP